MLSASTLLTVTSATLTAIQVTPATNTIAINSTAELVATGTYSDNTTANLTQSVTWSSSSATTASVSNAAGSQGTVLGLAGGNATITATLGTVSGTATVTVTAASLVSIVISPANPSLPLGTTVALTAHGTYSDASVVDITSSVTWATDSATVATIGNAGATRGVVTAVATGTTAAHATLGAITASTGITVTAAALVSIAITPANPSVPAGTSQALVATASYSDGSKVDVTATAVWSSSATNVATVSNAAGAQGDVTAVAVGTTTVKAVLSGVTGSTAVTVSAPTVKQIVVGPIASSLRVGQTARYTATAILSDNTQRDVTAQSTWQSSDTATATLTRGFGGGGGEVATAVAAGTTTITATYQGTSGSTSLTVTSPTLSEITVTPIAASLLVGATQPFVATAIYSDNTSQDVTAQATWVSSAPAVAQVSTAGGGGPGGGPGGGARGTVTGIATGSATISATLNGITGSTTVQVTAATLVQISISPGAVSTAVGSQQLFTAQALFSDGTSRDVTAAATWQSSNPTSVGVSDAGGPGGGKGLAKALVAGTATVSASYQGITGTATYTVTSAPCCKSKSRLRSRVSRSGRT